MKTQNSQILIKLNILKYSRITKNICFLFFILLVNEIKSQYSTAGLQGAIYVDITPDTLLNPAPYPGANEYYYIDINQDGVNDVQIEAAGVISPGSTNEAVNLLSLDTNTRFSFWKTDSVYHPGSCGGATWSVIGVLKPYNLGDTIKNGNYVTHDYICTYYTAGSCNPPYVFSSSEWIDSTDHYIGIKYSGTSGISYGWIRVKVTNYQTVLIKDFSLGIPLMGIEKFANNEKVQVYPNPASTIMNVELGMQNENAEIKVVDILGNEVINAKLNQLNVSNLQNGVYFVQVKTSEGILTKKIIIQH